MTKEKEFLTFFANAAKEEFEKKMDEELFQATYGMKDFNPDICYFTEVDNPKYIWNRT